MRAAPTYTEKPQKGGRCDEYEEGASLGEGACKFPRFGHLSACLHALKLFKGIIQTLLITP